MTWTIDCGHWHCPERYDTRHGHHTAPEECPECAEERPQSERARSLIERAEQIAQRKGQA